ncbi:DUF2079 domain-containing protein [Halococcus saccharolyticus]|uniref:DUF2079 domain-containing protein n=1 Tax=Halococcus saccharolyticus DSM 5350 TaxID=1227455 RepID=M0MPB5_9EURY|nr:DUF2079 domain-containing protein [Halococcus saccharolyticus]EMA47537.1 hypothetical protein C449_01186 [Halococcus saccharolyticus DSM 5350]
MSTADRLGETARAYLPERGDPTWYVLGLALALFIGFSIYLSLLYRSFWLTGADFGSYVHMFETTLDGSGFLEQGKFTVRGPESSYWGGHFTATLLAFLPIYALFPSPYTLLVIKSALLAASVPMLWVLAREHLDSDRIAGLLTASYALNPFLWSAWLFDFQEQILLPLLLFAAYYTYAQRRYVAFLAFLTLSLFTNEFVTLLAGGFLVGLAVASYRGGRLRAEAWVFGVAIGILVVARTIANWAIGQYSDTSGLPTDVIAAPLQAYVEGSRVGLGRLIEIVLANPTLIIDSIAVDVLDKATFLVLLLIPVLFVAAVDEVSLGALVPFFGFAWVFAGRDVYYTFGAHYPLYLLPFVYIGAVRVLAWLDLDATIEREDVRASARTVLSGLLVLVLVANLVVGVGMAAQKNAVPTTNDHTETLHEGIEAIPANASVLTQNDVFPHVADRENATFTANRTLFYRYQRANERPQPEYILLDTQLETQRIEWAQPIRQIYLDQFGTTYGLQYYEDEVWVFRRGYNGSPSGLSGSYAVEPRTYEPNDFIPNDALTIDGKLVGSGGAEGIYYWYGPGTMLPPGEYTATFRVNATSESSQPVANLEVAAGVTPRQVANETVTNTDGTENVTVEFSLDRMESNVEFRAVRAGGEGRLALENVTVASRETVGNTNTANGSG